MSHRKRAGSYHIPIEMLPVSVSWNGKGHQELSACMVLVIRSTDTHIVVMHVVHGATLCRGYDTIIV